MKIQIASDLHLERGPSRERFMESPMTKSGDILVLAGDICNQHRPDLAEFFFDDVKDKFDTVIYIPGNHEYYGGNFQYERDFKFVNKEDNLVYLNNNTYVKDDVRFICSTLWSGVSYETTNCINDYYLVKGFNLMMENKVHQDSIVFVEGELKKKWSGKTIVVTHHLPLWECIDELYRTSKGNDAFASDQKRLFQYDIDCWIHGHSHKYQKFWYNDTMVIRNPFGYKGFGGETLGFIEDCVIDV